jgi:hypothetical protein|tara:strand:- start:199 stop:330 length:132 start_codon:yes stop_codon:yes gene_type:complete
MLLGIILGSFVLAAVLTLIICDRLINGEAEKELKELKKELGYE